MILIKVERVLYCLKNLDFTLTTGGLKLMKTNLRKYSGNLTLIATEKYRLMISKRLLEVRYILVKLYISDRNFLDLWSKTNANTENVGSQLKQVETYAKCMQKFM